MAVGVEITDTENGLCPFPFVFVSAAVVVAVKGVPVAKIC